jgi:hypothetical protein
VALLSVAVTIGLALADEYLRLANTYQGAVTENARRAADAIGVANGASGDAIGLLGNLSEYAEDAAAYDIDALVGLVSTTTADSLRLADAFLVLANTYQGSVTENARRAGEAIALTGSVMGDALGFLPDLLDFLPTFDGISAQLMARFSLLVANVKALAEEFARQANTAGISEAWERAATALSNTFGGAADAVMKYIDLVQALGEKLPLTVAGGPNPFGSWWGGTSPNPMLDPTQVAARVAPIIEGIRSIARAMAQAAVDLQAEGVDVGAGSALGQNVSGMVGGVISMVDALDKLSTVRVSGQGLQNLRDLMFQVFGIVAGQAGTAAQVQVVVDALDAALGALASLASAQGYAAGSNWVDGFVAAVNAGMSQMGGVFGGTGSGSGAAAPGGAGGTGTGGGQVIQQQTNIYVTQYATDSQLRSSAGNILSLEFAYGS